MGQTMSLTGMVLNAAPAGEYDKRITLLTRERGKVTAFVRGARRQNSPLRAAANMFCFGSYEAYEGRETYTVVKADVVNYFSELYTDPDKAWYGYYFLELADYFTRPAADASDQLRLLYQTVRALLSKSLDPRLVRCIYELKTLVYYGVSPNVFSCAECEGKDSLRIFSPQRRGVLCSLCGGEGVVLPDAGIYTLQFIVSQPVEKLYTFRVTEEVYAAVREAVSGYLRLYADREFKTVRFLPEQ